jgi:catechol 2,3-dioxygenase-like lactoylglutathione lyase family enzyme
MSTDAVPAPAPPSPAPPPRGLNHVVLNVQDLEVSHRFWTEIVGFRCVAELRPLPGRRRPKMRFYSGVGAHGEVTHHDLALAEVPATEAAAGDPDRWELMPSRIGLNHVAVAWPDRESWLARLALLRAKGIPFLRRVNHGMTHSVYIADPDGHGIEILYELPRPVWEGDIEAAQNYAEQLPTEGDESLVDRTDNPVFGGAPVTAS